MSDASGNVINGWKPLNLKIPDGFVVRGIYQDPKTGADAFMAYNPITKEVGIGVAGTNGVGHDMPDTHSDFVKVGANQATWLLSPASGLVKDLAKIQTESGISHVTIGGQSLAGGTARMIGYELSKANSLFKPEDMSVITANPLGVATASKIMGYNFGDVQNWSQTAQVINFTTYNQEGDSDLVSILGGPGVGRYFGLDVFTDTNSSIGGLHPFNFGISEGINYIGGDFTRARPINAPQPLTHESIISWSSKINDLIGVDNNWLSIGVAGFASMLISRPGETSSSISNFLRQYFNLSGGVADAVGFGVESLSRIASYTNPSIAAYFIMSAFGVGKAIGSSAPALPSFPAAHGVRSCNHTFLNFRLVKKFKI